MRMERVNEILQHTLYRSCRRQIDEKEKDRIFCGHDMGHLLDVARLAWIFNLEANQEISKERIYAAALLHDIGRHIQYENGTPHQIAGLPIAEQILTDCGFYPEEMKEILYAIENHRNKEMLKRNDLAGILYRADKMSRCSLWLPCRKRVQLEHGKEKYGDTVLRQNIRKEEKQMKIGNKEFDLKNHAYVMGILNVTPDSFSDGGKWNDKGRAMRHTQEMIEQGATIIDIGGESTRPGYTLISDEEEISRVVPMIEMVKKNFDVPVSIDTYKSRVAEAALDAGADLVNDIWGLKYDPDLAGVIARKNAPCCLMHNRKEPDYTDFIADFLKDMQETIDIAKKAGIADENIILDPGVGFGKTYENNLEIINKLECMHALGYPILLGTSRKSVIGLTLDLPADQRMEGTVATTVIGVMKGVAFVRVHDVKENYRALKMTEAILGR